MKTKFYIHRSGQDGIIDFQFGELNGIYNCSEDKVVNVISNGEEANDMALKFVNGAVGQSLKSVGEAYLHLIPITEEEETGWIVPLIYPNIKMSTNIQLEKEEDECTK